jgi:hypothetical protein
MCLDGGIGYEAGQILQRQGRLQCRQNFLCTAQKSLDKIIRQFYIAVVLQCSKTSAGTLTKSA